MSYNHALINDMRNSCKKHTSDDNDALYPRVAAGDEAARQDMICNNMPLVVSIVDSYLQALPNLEHMRDDLTSEGFLGLTEAVNNAAKPGFVVNNPTAYLSRAVRYHLFREINQPAACPLTDGDTSATYSDSSEVVDVRDLIEACCESDFDREVTALRASKHTIRDVALLMGCSRMEVQRALQAIEARYNERSQEN